MSSVCRVSAPPEEIPHRLTAIGFPDPFAVATVDGEQTKTTSVSKRTLNPYWNETFDL
jgi:Ca2+-dependent lipid-binding protein